MWDVSYVSTFIYIMLLILAIYVIIVFGFGLLVVFGTYYGIKLLIWLAPRAYRLLKWLAKGWKIHCNLPPCTGLRYPLNPK